MKKILIGIGSIVSIGLPSLVLAAGPNIGSGSYLGTMMTQGSQLLQLVVALLQNAFGLGGNSAPTDLNRMIPGGSNNSNNYSGFTG